MKKFAMILAASGLALAACSNEDEPTTETNEDAESAAEVMTDTDEAEETESTEEGEGVNVDKGHFNVEVTIPPSFLEGEDLEQAAAEANSEDELEATVNDDGSITYKMSKAQHDEMMQDIASNIDRAAVDITESGEYPSILAVEASSDYDHFTVQVDREVYEGGFDGFATVTLGLTGSIYQIFDGADADSYEVNIDMEDAETGEIFNTITYPDVLDEMGGE